MPPTDPVVKRAVGGDPDTGNPLVVAISTAQGLKVGSQNQNITFIWEAVESSRQLTLFFVLSRGLWGSACPIPPLSCWQIIISLRVE